jgi:hypothetical protein
MMQQSWAQLRFPYTWADGTPCPQPHRPARLRLKRQIELRQKAIQAVIPIVRMWDGTTGAVPEESKSSRKCSPFARARTINVQKLPKRQREAAHSRSFWDVELDRLRPKTRADCKTGPRPCIWIGCRYHTAITLDIERGSIKENFPHLKIWSDPDGDGLERLELEHGTCSLDIADKHDDGTEGVGGLIALYQAATSGKPMGMTPGMTIEEVGSACNVSVERIRQLGSAALQEMRVKLRRLEG